MRTQQELSQARAEMGLSDSSKPSFSTGLTGNLRGKTLADSIRKQFAPPTPTTHTDPNMISAGGVPIVGGLAGKVLKPVVKYGEDVAKNAYSTAKESAQKIGDYFSKSGQDYANAPNTTTGNLVEKPLILLKGLSDIVNQAGKGAINTVFSPISTLISANAKELGNDLPAIGEDKHPILSNAIDSISSLGKSVEELKQAHPQIADAVDKLWTLAQEALLSPKTQSSRYAKDYISHSEGMDVQGSIANGDIARESVYSTGNTLKPDFAQGRISDIAQKLDKFKPGLGDKFLSQVNPNEVTMTGNAPEELVKLAHNLIDQNSLSPVETAAGMAAKDIGEVVSKVVKPVANKVGEFGKSAIETVSDTSSALKEGVTNITGKIRGVASAKPVLDLEKVYATPEEGVTKLNPTERGAWWKHQSDLEDTAFKAEQAKIKTNDVAGQEKINDIHRQKVADITQKAMELENQIEAGLKAKTEASLMKTQELKTKVDQASNTEATNLKSEAIQVYKNNSNKFQQLFEKEFTPEKQATPLSQADIIQKLDTEFADNPELNPKDRLGLDAKGKDITAKDLYDRVRSLKLTAAGSKGTSTFMAGDLAINRTRGVMSEILGENGVDLGEANRFWQEWKPLQREITAKVKPFEPGYKTGTMAKILRDAASETGDAKNAKFIADLEDQLGHKIGGQTRVEMENLTQAQKQMIADKVASEEAKANVADQKRVALETQKTETIGAKRELKSGTQSATEELKAKTTQAKEDIYNRQFNSEQVVAETTRIKARNRRILYYVLGLIGLGTGTIKVFGI